MNNTSAIRLPVFDLDFGNRAANGLSLAPVLHIAAPAPQSEGASAPVVVLRHPDLVADLRRARAARFADRYEWLALRRRRAQIAARHALG